MIRSSILRASTMLNVLIQHLPMQSLFWTKTWRVFRAPDPSNYLTRIRVFSMTAQRCFVTFSGPPNSRRCHRLLHLLEITHTLLVEMHVPHYLGEDALIITTSHLLLLGVTFLFIASILVTISSYYHLGSLVV